MAVDLRQVLAAFLTFSMFIMLGNMIKRDHIDPLWDPSMGTAQVQERVLKQSGNDPWKNPDDAPKPCWKKVSTNEKVKDQESNGYIFFSLTHGPEFHASQVANAVTVAKHLGAKLALPDIRGTKSREKMRSFNFLSKKFEEIYDVDTFIETLRGVVQVDKNPAADLSKRSTIVRVPNRVSNKFVSSNIEPIFRNNQNLKIITDFNSSSSSRNVINHKSLSNEHQCLAMFEALKLQPKLQELVDSMMDTMRGLSHRMGGRFITVDFKVETLRKKHCMESDTFGKWCYSGEQIGEFLKKIGFFPETTIYLTQTGWDSSLDPLRNVFPSTFTKDSIIPADKKALYLGSETHEYEKYIDFYMCAQSDVFVPAFPGRFYHSVVGTRIGDGKTQVLVPAMDGSASAEDYISPYIAKKGHYAYSCFC